MKELMKYLIRVVPTWLIGLSLFAFVILFFSSIFITEKPFVIWGKEFGAPRLGSERLRIETGWKNFDRQTAGWDLHLGSQDINVFKHFVNFDPPFGAPPKVVVALKRFNLGSGTNPKVDVDAMDVTNSGFTIQIRTWDGSKLYDAGVTWVVLGN